MDPVCGMEVDPATAEFGVQHEGKRYSFCSKSCLDDFLADPAKYVGT
jgi:Cu+-exporting ATPase